MTSNGSYMNGYDVLVAKYIAEKLDMDLEITQIDWDGLILSIQSGKVDCAIAGMSITSERSQSVDFSDPYYNANIVAVVAADGPYADAVNVTDFEGATLTSTPVSYTHLDVYKRQSVNRRWYWKWKYRVFWSFPYRIFPIHVLRWQHILNSDAGLKMLHSYCPDRSTVRILRPHLRYKYEVVLYWDNVQELQ